MAKAVKNVEITEPPLSPKELRKQRFVEGLVDGKSMRQAALDAGYSQSMADHAGVEIMPNVRDIFRKAMHHRISVGKLSSTIAAGLDAEKTEFFQKDGVVTDQRNVIAWGERREYAKLAANLMAFEPESKEQTTNVAVAVQILSRTVGDEE